MTNEEAIQQLAVLRDYISQIYQNDHDPVERGIKNNIMKQITKVENAITFTNSPEKKQKEEP